MPYRWSPLTADPSGSKVERVLKALRRAGAFRKSNRVLAAECRVDERMVRKYRALLGLPKLLPGSGLPEGAGKRRRKRR